MNKRSINGIHGREPITRVQFTSIAQGREFFRRVRAGFGHRVAAIIVGAHSRAVWAL